MTVETASRDEDGWFVSSFTNGSGSCVQVKFAGPGSIMVRDSKDLRAAPPIMSMPSEGWACMLDHITNSA